MFDNAVKLTKKFLPQIRNNEWEEIYSELMLAGNPDNVGLFTVFLLNAGINPLLYMDYVPGNFLYNTCNLHINFPIFEIPNHISEIRTNAFYNSCVKDLVFPSSIRNVRFEAFDMKNDINIHIHDIDKFLASNWRDGNPIFNSCSNIKCLNNGAKVTASTVLNDAILKTDSSINQAIMQTSISVKNLEKAIEEMNRAWLSARS